MLDAAVLIANHHAGRVDDAAVGAVCRALSRQLSLEVVVTPCPDAVPAVVDGLDGRPLLVMGGDGTLNVGIRAMHRAGLLAGTPVGFIPAGTANAFARAIGLSLDPPTSAGRLVGGRRRRFDLLVSDRGDVAVNDLHTGLGVPATQLSARLKPFLRQLTYPVANALSGLRAPGWDIAVTVDGHAVVSPGERVLMVAIGNTGLIGDGTPLWPDADPHDGAADVVVAMVTNRYQRARVGLSVRTGDHVTHPAVRTARGSRIVLAGDVPGHNADGEVSEDAGESSWSVEAGGWQLLC